MILAINIGNTNTVLGCIDGSKCVFVERISTVKTKTELEYAIDIKNVLDIYHIKKADLEGGIISSVVPQITMVVKAAVEKILKKEVLIRRRGDQDRIKYQDRQSGAAWQRPCCRSGGRDCGISDASSYF